MEFRPNMPTDLDLLRRFTDHGDEAAFGDLVERHAGMVYAACRRRLRDPSLADDAAQAVFVILSRKAARLRQERSLAEWLYRVCDFVARNSERQQQRRKRHERASVAQRHAAEHGDDSSPLRASLDAAVGRLPDRYRSVVVMHYLLGKERVEIADALKLKPEAVDKRLQRAVERLRRMLAPEMAGSASMVALLGTIQPLAPVTNSHPPALDIISGSVSGRVRGLAHGGLRLMNIATAKFAACAAALLCSVIIGGIAIAAAAGEEKPKPEPKPALGHELGYAKEARSFYIDSVLLFDLPLPAEVSTQLNVPQHVAQWSMSQVRMEPTAQGWRCITRPLMCLIAVGHNDEQAKPEKQTMTVSDPDGIQRTIAFESIGLDIGRSSPGLPSWIHLEKDGANLRVDHDNIADFNTMDMESFIDYFGLPNIVLPIASGTYADGAALPVDTSAMMPEIWGTYVGGDNRAISFDFVGIAVPERSLYEVNTQAFGFDVRMSISVAAEGSGKIRAAWDDKRRFVRDSMGEWAFEIFLGTRIEGGEKPAALFPGKVAIKRHSRLIDGEFTGDIRKDAAALREQLFRQRFGGWWKEIQKPGVIRCDVKKAEELMKGLAVGAIQVLDDRDSLTFELREDPHPANEF
jgi:RNA polymerase sigma factor (sigma-70 family)